MKTSVYIYYTENAKAAELNLFFGKYYETGERILRFIGATREAEDFMFVDANSGRIVYLDFKELFDIGGER